MIQWLMPVRAYTLYGVTIFLGAFLLFQIQPLIARYLLPFFGGATAVWATSLLFFTSILFLGYAYAYCLSRLSHRLQTRIHMGMLLIGVLVTLSYPVLFGSTYPPLDGVIDGSLAPALKVLLALALTIGIPYFLLATTGPLVQHWFGIMESKEPYHLYALSNAASFIALGTYPFVIEPMFALNFQKGFWTALFIVFAALYACVTFFFARHRAQQDSRMVTQPVGTIISWSEKARWVSFAAVPAVLLVATTAQLTQVVAPVPFIWVVPLALYLLTFIIAFRGYGNSGMVAALVLISAWGSFSLLGFSYEGVTRQMATYVAMFFFASLYCHAQLFATRPETRHSALFYLCIACGGMLGTLLVSIVAPMVFNDILEFPLGIMVVAGIGITFFPAMRYIRDEYEQIVTSIRLLALVGIFALGIQYMQQENQYYSLVSRNFYGVVKIWEDAEERTLSHGNTMHGRQFKDEKRSRQPTSYYVPSSGIGRALTYEQQIHPEEGITVGVLGLGTGSIAAHCRPQDQYVFYEIDPRMEDIARAQFTYLKNCENTSVRYGDGRLLLEKEMREKENGKYDVLVVAAFSDDTLPTHLLTKEAVALYLEHLRGPESILAIITSNRYITLTPVALRIAEALRVPAVFIEDDGESYEGGASSDWVLISKDSKAFSAPAIAPGITSASADADLWTDEYVNLFGAVDLPGW